MKKNVCGCGHCTPQCMGMKKIVIGILVILNAKYAWFDWATFIGGIIVLIGLVKLSMPVCPCQKK